MHKLFYLLVATFAVLSVATACDDNNAGQSIVDSEVQLITDSSFTIKAKTVESGRIQSRTKTQLLGIIQSPEYGNLTSDFVTEFMPASVMDTTGVSVADIDSINLTLHVPMGAYTGDSITPMKVNVYKLKKNLPYPIYSDFNPEEYYDKSDFLGSKSYAMSSLNQDSVLYYQYDNQGNVNIFQVIAVGLPKQLGKDFYNKYLTEPELFKSPEAFSKYFPGIYATTSFGNGRVIKISDTYINMFYKKHDKTEEGKDTVYQRSSTYFGVSPEIVTNNNIRLSPSQTLTDMANAGTPVLMAPAGYEVEITLPFNAMLAKFEDLKKTGQVVANTVSLSIGCSDIKNGQGINPPQYLLLIKKSEKDKFFLENKLPDNVKSFYATYDSSKKKYEFSGLRAYLKQLIDGDIKMDETVEDFMLVPIDMEIEIKQDYYGETQTIIKKVTPQVSAPAMVSIDLAKTIIAATYSKKNFNN